MYIPNSLKQTILKEWLQGYTRDEIAFRNNVSAGLVSNLLQELRNEVPDLDLMRELAVQMKKANTTLNDVAPALRLKNRLERLGVSMVMAEDLIEQIHVNCFKKNVEVPDFLTIMFNLLEFAKNKKIDLWRFEDYVCERVEYYNKLVTQERNQRKKNSELIEKYNNILSYIKRFESQIPILQQLQLELQKNSQNTIIIQDLQREVFRLRSILDDKYGGQRMD